MPRVLVVTHRWLPAQDGAVKRVAILARYLPEAGWDPIILAGEAADEDAADPSAAGDAELPALRAARALPLVTVPPASRSNAALRWREALDATAGQDRPWRGRDIARRALAAAYPLYGEYPDTLRGWADSAVVAGIGALRQYGIGAVVSVSPPDSVHIAAGEIARRAGVPWIPVFGDAGAPLGIEHGRSLPARAAHRALARHWLRGAAGSGASSPDVAARVRHAFGHLAEPVGMVFDPDERRLPPRRAPGSPLRLVRAGPLDASDAAVPVLLDALDRLLRHDPSTATALRVELIGTGSEGALGELLSGRPAGAVVTLSPQVSPAAAVARRREADVLLAIEPADGAGALLEQLNARRPVIAIAPEDGLANRLLAETRGGSASDSAEGVARLVRMALDDLAREGEVPYAGQEGALARYAGPEQARRLGQLLDAASAGRIGSWQRQ